MAESKEAGTGRLPFKGSCHCGKIKYMVYMSFPPPLEPYATAQAGTRIRKCNCSTCHKLSFFHVRLQHAPRDFILLSPSTPDECNVYKCFEKNISWCFCSTCSVMPFAHWWRGEGDPGERVEVEVDGEKRMVWRPRADWREGSGWAEGKNAYLSVNAVTIEPGQEGFDLREWHEKGWINYLDTLDCVDENHFGRPSKGGMY